MRGLTNSQIELYPALFGSMSVTAKTAVGSAIDTRGFRGVLATLVAGCSVGSSGATTLALTVKMQESIAAGAIADSWADITNGVVNGSFKLTALSFTATGPTMQMAKMWERLDRPNAKRYIRAHATVAGTTGLGIRFAVNLLLTHPIDTAYCVTPTSFATNNAESYYSIG
jgi:hypothetical protein